MTRARTSFFSCARDSLFSPLLAAHARAGWEERARLRFSRHLLELPSQVPLKQHCMAQGCKRQIRILWSPHFLVLIANDFLEALAQLQDATLLIVK